MPKQPAIYITKTQPTVFYSRGTSTGRCNRHPSQPKPGIEVSDEALLAKYDRLIVYEAKKAAKSYAFGSEAEDIAQEARIKLCLLRPDVRDADAYIRTVIYNSVRDSIRKLKHQTDGLLFIETDPEPGERTDWTIAEEDLPIEHQCPAEALSDRVLAQRLFSSLSAEQILVVSVWFGLDGGDAVHSARSVSRRTGIKEARVESILRAALAKLRKEAKRIQTPESTLTVPFQCEAQE